MWDYEAQDQGELSIRVGDVILILSGDSDPDGWWTGRLHGNTGIFPGNYESCISSGLLYKIKHTVWFEFLI